MVRTRTKRFKKDGKGIHKTMDELEGIEILFLTAKEHVTVVKTGNKPILKKYLNFLKPYRKKSFEGIEMESTEMILQENGHARIGRTSFTTFTA
jgi:hypothetical protein